jgi:HEAT repeat protein
VKVDARQVARWIEQLDDDDFETRENATAQLAKLGSRAVPALLTAKAPSSVEASSRIEQLLAKLKEAPDFLRPQRSVDLLARIGSPEARTLLETLAQGPADSILTQSAKIRLARLQKSNP